MIRDASNRRSNLLFSESLEEFLSYIAATSRTVAKLMHIIELDAANWKTVLDFYNALLPTLGAPEWHGRSIDSLLDSMVWGGINSLEPPFTVHIQNTKGLAPDIREEIKLLAQYIPEHRAAYRAREGEDVDVNLEIVS